MDDQRSVDETDQQEGQIPQVRVTCCKSSLGPGYLSFGKEGLRRSMFENFKEGDELVIVRFSDFEELQEKAWKYDECSK